MIEIYFERSGFRRKFTEQKPLIKTNIFILLSKKAMTRSQVEYILALAKTRNFGKAAEACFVTQSTLSAMVAKYEEQNGVILFNRKTRPISITRQGEKIINSLKNIHREFQLLDETINEIKGYEIGHCNIGCIPTVAPYLYPLILNPLSRKYPQVNFSIHELTTEKMVAEIIGGSIDIGIVSTPLENKELVEHPLYEEDFLLYDCGKKTSRKSQYKITDIDLDRLWLLEEGHCLRNQVGKICELRQQKKINGNLTYSCGSIFTLIEMVKRNNGVTLLPRLAIEKNQQIDEKHLHHFHGITPTRKIGIITHKNYLKTRLLSKLIDIIREVVHSQLPGPKSKTKFFKPF